MSPHCCCLYVEMARANAKLDGLISAFKRRERGSGLSLRCFIDAYVRELQAEFMELNLVSSAGRARLLDIVSAMQGLKANNAVLMARLCPLS